MSYWKTVCLCCALFAAAAIASPAQVFTTLANFGGVNGSNPFAGVVQGFDGNFYGTTYYGGANSSGTVFKITPAGKLITLYSFCAESGCTDGAHPSGSLVQASNGDFYGTTLAGGANDDGTVFKITLTLHQPLPCSGKRFFEDRGIIAELRRADMRSPNSCETHGLAHQRDGRSTLT